jgi:TRAP-type uncharacterized transport system substrate-binding protein
MLASSLKALKLAKFTWLWQLFNRKRSHNVQDTSPPGKRARIVSAKGIDIDSIEEMMNRRMRMIWVRHTWFVIIIGTLLFIGLIGVSVFFSVKPTVFRVAVGPSGTDDVRFVEKFAERLKNEHQPVRIQPIVKDGPVSVTDIRGKPEFDIAVVRGNMALSADWPVVAILRQNVVALIVPAPSARAKPKVEAKSDKDKAKSDKAAAKPAKPPKIEKVGDLAGKRVGIVAATDGGPELLDIILRHYGVPREKVQSVEIPLGGLKAAVHDNKIDAILVAGPQTGKAIEGAVLAASHGKDAPTFIAVDQAEGIGKRTPPYDKVDVPAGAFGGVPPVPAEELTTLAYPLYLVARKNLNEDKMATFSKLVYTSRQALAYETPGAIAIESPSTDKDAAVLVHPGTAAYLGDNQKSVFDKYGDLIFYGLLVGPIIGSGLLGLLGYVRADKNTRRIREMHRLIQLVRKARTISSVEELDNLQDEADNILADILQETERGQLDEGGLAAFKLAIEQARLALSEQRSMLVLRPENVPAHHLSTRSTIAAAE